MQSIGWGVSHDLYDSWMFFREGVTAKFHHSRVSSKRAILNRVKIELKALEIPKL